MNVRVKELVCKARRKDNDEWVEGFYFCLHHNDGRTHLHHLIIPLEADLSKGTPIDKIQVEVVPESITLKAQEPRVMTLEEITKAEVVWTEYSRFLFENAEMIELPHHPLKKEDKTWDFQTSTYEVTEFLDEYGKTWRCWTSRPTDEQREATPWNDLALKQVSNSKRPRDGKSTTIRRHWCRNIDEIQYYLAGRHDFPGVSDDLQDKWESLEDAESIVSISWDAKEEAYLVVYRQRR